MESGGTDEHSIVSCDGLCSTTCILPSHRTKSRFLGRTPRKSTYPIFEVEKVLHSAHLGYLLDSHASLLQHASISRNNQAMIINLYVLMLCKKYKTKVPYG